MAPEKANVEEAPALVDFKNDELGVSFSVPTELTVNDQLRFYGVTGGSTSADTFLSLWEGVKMLAVNWECKALPKLKSDLSEAVDPSITRIVIWAGSQLMGHISRLGQPPKAPSPKP